MNSEIIKIIVDKPYKSERLIYFILQLFITSWFLQLIGSYWIDDIPSTLNLFNYNYLKEVSFIDAATYMVSLIGVWIFFWGLLSRSIVTISLLIIFRSLHYIFIGCLFAIFLVIYLIYGLTEKIKKRPFPEKFWGDFNKNETEYVRKMRKLRNDLSVFLWINRRWNGSLGSRTLLQLIEHGGNSFLRSRMLQYYTMASVIYVYHLFQISGKVLNTYYEISLLIVFTTISFIVHGLNENFKLIKQKSIRALKPQLEFDLYKAMIHEAVRNSSLMNFYTAKRDKKSIVLQWNDHYSYQDESVEFKRTIEIVPIHAKHEFNVDQINNEEGVDDSIQTVFVSKEKPDSSVIKLFETNNILFILAETEQEVIDGLQKLESFFKPNATFKLR